ncbi:MAG TPA: Do family serine endopeptidase [Nevskiaceae bacterium]
MRNVSHRCCVLGVVAMSTLMLAGCGRSASPPDFSGLVKRVSPSVVNITASSTANGGDAALQPDAPASETPDWARKYLQRAAPDADGDATQGGDDALSTGSGFVLWPDGYILTDQHVIDGSRDITVSLSDGRELAAKVAGVDRRTDIALLKVDAEHLPAVRIAHGGGLSVGQWVLAIGSPFGFADSVTAGIVSALGRNLSAEQYVPFIQTDVAINPGNSGGPLFNMQGEVVGVNSQIYSQTGGFMGVAFAVPIDVAVRVARQLRDTGKVERGWMGVTVQTLTLPLAESFGLKVPRGALVTGVSAGGPAAQAGIRAGDVLLSFNGRELKTSRSLPPLVGEIDPGRTVPLKVLRDGRVVELSVELGRLPSAHEAAPRADDHGGRGKARQPAVPGAPELGLVLRAASASELSRAGVDRGLLVQDVGAGPAREAGLQPGDVIISVGGQHPRTAAQFQALIGRLTPGSRVPFLVQRGSGPMFLAVQVPTR